MRGYDVGVLQFLLRHGLFGETRQYVAGVLALSRRL